MSKFQIRRRFSHHEGGTKAYQVYEFQMGDAVVPVFQWGSFSTGMDPTRMGGTFDVKDATSVSVADGIARRQQGAKTRRGYTDWTTDTVTAANRTEFDDLLVQLLGRKEAAQVIAKLAASPLSKVSSSAPTPAPENSNKGKAKPPAIKIEESAPEWGTW
jgi:hypothetical protein